MMLIRFKVGNFLSFDSVQELSMISGETRNHPDHVFSFKDFDVLRISAVYGANASGKSNLIKALSQSKLMITRGMSIFPNNYFKLIPANGDKPSYFEYELESNGKYYSYGFEIVLSKSKIQSEWLYELKPDGENDIFYQRNGNKITHSFEGDDGTRMDIYAKDMERSDNLLFLTEMSRKTRTDKGRLSVLSEVFEWFNEKVKTIDMEFVPGSIYAGEDRIRNTIGLLGALGTGITGASLERVENAQAILGETPLNLYEKMLRNKDGHSIVELRASFGKLYNLSISENKELVVSERMFKHGNPDISFNIDEESEGTQRLYDLLHMIVSEDESIYILDELDIKLHPQLTYRFVELFLREKAGTKCQLIFTTHESYLMDFKLLRRDEIWFVEKEADGSSSLYSLEDFNERTDKRIDKAYLEGRYGGVPLFSMLFPPTGK